MAVQIDPVVLLLEELKELEIVLTESDRGDIYRGTYVTLYKSALIGIGSFFEREFMDIVETRSRESANTSWVAHLIRKKALDRQFHTFFDFKGLTFGPLFGMFGDDFKTKFKEKTSSEEGEACSKAFLALCAERNVIAHNFWTAPVNRTQQELESSYLQAKPFLPLFATLLSAENE